jgi:outer membrane protein, multidrug efflux system
LTIRNNLVTDSLFMKKIYTYSYSIIFTAFLIGSCSIPQKTVIKYNDGLPTHFEDSINTVATEVISKKLFFPDNTLRELVDTALKNNPDLLIALQKINMAKSGMLIAKGLSSPSLDAVVSAGLDKFGDYTMNGIGNYDMNLSSNINKNQRIPLNMPDLFIGFRTSWEADIWGKLSERKKAAYSRYLSTIQAQQWIATQLATEIAVRYYELLALDNEQEILHNNIRLQENAVEIVIAQKAGGRATELAVQQFSAQLLSTKSILYSIKQQIVTTENEINALTGKFSQKINRGKQITDLAIPNSVNAGIPSQLLVNRPDIKEAELLLVACGAELEASRKAFLPSLNMTAYTALNSFNPSFLISPQSIAYGILSGLVTPILSKNLLKSNYGFANAAQEEAFQQYRKTVLNAYREVVTELKGIEYYKEVFALKQKETAILQSAVTTSKELYLTGYASYLEVITAQRGVLEAELESINSKKKIFVYLINLYRSLGGGWK